MLTTPVVCVLIFCTEYQHIHFSATWHTKSLYQISFHWVQSGRIINDFLTSRFQTPLMNVVCHNKNKFPNTITSTVDKNVAFEYEGYFPAKKARKNAKNIKVQNCWVHRLVFRLRSWLQINLTSYNHHQRKLEILWLHYELPKNNFVTLTHPKLLIYDLANSNNVLKTCDPRTNVSIVEIKANCYWIINISVSLIKDLKLSTQLSMYHQEHVTAHGLHYIRTKVLNKKHPFRWNVL
jgi:hypothetical protein